MNPDIFTADYVGEPGKRSFYLQARGEEGLLSFPIEKQQVVVLAEKLRELLLLVDGDDTVTSASAGRDPALAFTEPVSDETQVGTIGLAYEEDADLVVVLLQPLPEESDEDEVELDEASGVHLELRRDQVRAFVLHAIAVVNEGRAICQLCGLPMDPAGHKCPASNGHRLSD
ncbi:DUF3090 domain-containing protein [soil metagenome]|nr:DUF3090 family protein [Actinomycetota bacterium]MDQ3216476.1 DUF3090 family protein [Actinomycetota bacterium]